jgi:hypothetical protein
MLAEAVVELIRALQKQVAMVVVVKAVDSPMLPLQLELSILAEAEAVLFSITVCLAQLVDQELLF